jgi:hypothetical protein
MSSSSSNNSSTASSSIISPHEFSCLITEPEMTRALARTFASRPTSTAILRYYFFLSRSIERLHQELERHHHEQNTLFHHLFESRRFRMKVQPIVLRYRQFTSRYHPYGRTPSPLNAPSETNDINLPSNTTIDEEIGSTQNPIVISDNEEAHDGTFLRQKTRRYRFHSAARSISMTSYRRTVSPIDDHDPSSDIEIHQRRQSLNDSQSFYPPNSEEPGTERNPIYVSEFDETRCGICNEGHSIVDCTKEQEAPIPDTQHSLLKAIKDILHRGGPSHGTRLQEKTGSPQ